MNVSTFRRRVVAVAAAAVVLTVLPQTPAMAVDDTISLTGVTAGEYVASGSTRTIDVSASTADTALSIDFLVDGLLVETQPCDPVGTTCALSFDLDTSGLLVGSHSVVVELTTDIGSQAATRSVSFKVGDAPTASVQSPTSGSFVGSVSVSVRGTTDPDGADYPASFELLVNGLPLPGGTAGPCAANARTCTQTITWSIAALAPGNRQISVLMTTQEGVEVLSSAVTLRVANAPTSTITSPADNAQNVLPSGSEIVSFNATGGSDAALLSQTKSFALFIDGGVTAVDTDTCTSTGTCAVTLQWDASAAPGASTHTAVVRVTVLGATATDTATFTLAEEPVVTVVSPPGGKVSGATSITVTAQTDGVTTEDPQSIVLTAVPGVGAPIVFPAETCNSAPVDGACTFTVPWDVSLLSGSFSLTARAHDRQRPHPHEPRRHRRRRQPGPGHHRHRADRHDPQGSGRRQRVGTHRHGHHRAHHHDQAVRRGQADRQHQDLRRRRLSVQLLDHVGHHAAAEPDRRADRRPGHDVHHRAARCSTPMASSCGCSTRGRSSRSSRRRAEPS